MLLNFIKFLSIFLAIYLIVRIIKNVLNFKKDVKKNINNARRSEVFNEPRTGNNKIIELRKDQYKVED